MSNTLKAREGEAGEVITSGRGGSRATGADGPVEVLRRGGVAPARAGRGGGAPAWAAASAWPQARREAGATARGRGDGGEAGGGGRLQGQIGRASCRERVFRAV